MVSITSFGYLKRNASFYVKNRSYARAYYTKHRNRSETKQELHPSKEWHPKHHELYPVLFSAQITSSSQVQCHLMS
uniref:Uncharacterized protein n=1 Tax=Amphimedon queenslandica TaxID=400682 RepID=A0A1X7VAJ1_AMPQE